MCARCEVVAAGLEQHGKVDAKEDGEDDEQLACLGGTSLTGPDRAWRSLLYYIASAIGLRVGAVCIVLYR